MRFVVRLYVFFGDRVEDFVGNIGANDFKREQLRLRETGGLRIGARDDIPIAFVERFGFFVGRGRRLIDEILRLKDGDFRLRHAVERGERFELLRGGRLNDAVPVSDLRQTHLRIEGREAAAVVLAEHALVRDLRFNEIAERGVVQTGVAFRGKEHVGTETRDFAAARLVVANVAREHGEVIDDRSVVGAELFFCGKFADEPAVHERFGVVRREVNLNA